MVGIGYVLTIQENKLVQVLVTRSVDEEFQSFWEKVTRNDGAVLSKLVIKPSIPRILEKEL